MSCVAEVAQRKKGMQGSGRGDGHKSHGGRGVSTRDSFTSDDRVNV